jgi:hypothetical protein
MFKIVASNLFLADTKLVFSNSSFKTAISRLFVVIIQLFTMFIAHFVGTNWLFAPILNYK